MANCTERASGFEVLYIIVVSATVMAAMPQPETKFVQGITQYARWTAPGGIANQIKPHGVSRSSPTIKSGRQPNRSAQRPQNDAVASVAAVVIEFNRPRPKKLSPTSRKQYAETKGPAMPPIAMVACVIANRTNGRF